MNRRHGTMGKDPKQVGNLFLLFGDIHRSILFDRHISCCAHSVCFFIPILIDFVSDACALRGAQAVLKREACRQL